LPLKCDVALEAGEERAKAAVGLGHASEFEETAIRIAAAIAPSKPLFMSTSLLDQLQYPPSPPAASPRTKLPRR
jgi:hypothetical protein